MATSTSTDSTQLLGIIKDTFAEKMKDAQMPHTIMQDEYKVDTTRAPIGKAFHLPVLVTNSQSTTYDVSQGTKTLTSATAPQSVDAQVVAFETTETLNIPYGMLAQADMGAKVSFASDQVIKMFSLWKGIKRQTEWSILYGQAQLGIIDVVTYSSGTTGSFTLKAGTYSPAYVSGMENAPIDVFDSTGATQENTNALIRVTAVSTTTNDQDTLSVSGNASDLAALATGQYVWRYGEHGAATAPGTPYTPVGLITQCSNTANVLITNMDPTKYTMLKGNPQTTFGNAGVQKFAKKVAIAKNRGAEGKAIMLVNPDVWGAISSELSQMKRYDTSYNRGKLENGAEAIQVRVGSVETEYREHPFLKAGDCILYFEDNIIRPGVSDVVDNLSGMDLSVMSSTTNSFQWRVWTSWALLYTVPAQSVVYQGVTVP